MRQGQPRQLWIGISAVFLSPVLIALTRLGLEFPRQLALGGLSIGLYGLCIALAILTVISLLGPKLARTEGPSDLWGGAVWVMISGVIGARLFHVLSEWQEVYQSDPLRALVITDGGLSLFGAVVFGLLAVTWWAKRHALPILPTLSSIAIILPVGQIIGRFGNFFNQELFGPPTNLPWGIAITRAQPSVYQSSTYFHPVFWYEQLLNLVLLIVLYYTARRTAQVGLFHKALPLLIYFFGYGIIRLAVEQLRLDPDYLFTFSFGELLAIIFCGASLILAIILRIHDTRSSMRHQ